LEENLDDHYTTVNSQEYKDQTIQHSAIEQGGQATSTIHDVSAADINQDIKIASHNKTEEDREGPNQYDDDGTVIVQIFEDN